MDYLRAVISTLPSVRNYMRRKDSLQVMSLLFSKGVTILLGLIVSSLNTHILRPAQFGQFVFITNLTNTLQLVFTPGIFHTGSRVLADEELSRDRQRSVIGGLLLIVVGVSAIHIALILFYSLFNDVLFSNNLATTLRYVSLFMFIFPAQICLNYVLQGLNRIYTYSVFQVTPYLLYSIVLSYFVFGGSFELSLLNVLVINYTSIAISLVLFYAVLKPDFTNVLESVKLLVRKNKGFGSYVFYGTLIVGGCTYLANYVIAYKLGTTEYGYYALAFTLAYPVSLIPSTVGTIFFKKAVNEKRYSHNVEQRTILSSLLVLMVFIAVLRPVFLLIYPEEFLVTVKLTYFLAGASLLQGIGDFYNKFAIARRKGKEIFYVSLVIGFIYIINIAVLINLIGIMGSIVSQIISSSLYLVGMYVLYRKSRRSSSKDF